MIEYSSNIPSRQINTVHVLKQKQNYLLPSSKINFSSKTSRNRFQDSRRVVVGCEHCIWRFVQWSTLESQASSPENTTPHSFPRPILASHPQSHHPNLASHLCPKKCTEKNAYSNKKVRRPFRQKASSTSFIPSRTTTTPTDANQI
jgi:hypothetical protein